MEYNKLVAVTGLPGLFEMINSRGDGAVVRSLDDQVTRLISGRVHKFSHLESIEIFTQGDNVNLIEIFKAMQESSAALPDVNNNDALKKYFIQVYPSLDFDKVYNSDMKKMIRWFEQLKKHNIEIKLTEPEEEKPEEQEEPEISKPEKEETPKKKKAARKKK